MRVLFVIDTLAIGGAERSISELAIALGREHAAVAVIYAGVNPLKGRLIEANIPVLELRVRGKYDFLRAVVRLCHCIRSYQPDIIHSTLFRSGIASRIAGALCRVPVVDSFVSAPYSAARTRQLSTVVSRLKHQAIFAMDRVTSGLVARYVANSHSVGRLNGEALAVPPDRIEVVYRGRDVGRYIPASAEKRISERQRLGVQQGEKVIAYVGRLIPRKRVDILIKALASIEGYEAALVVVGDGPERPELQRMAKGLRVVFAGELDDVIPALSLADCFASASEFEGLPGAVVEAMLCGVPCALSDIPMHRELDSPSRDLQWFDCSDVTSCAAALNYLLTEPRSASAGRGERLREHASIKFNRDEMVSQHVRVYERVLRDRG